MKMPEWIENPNPEIYLGDNYCVADFETTNRNKGSALERTNKIVLATWLRPDIQRRRELCRGLGGLGISEGSKSSDSKLRTSVQVQFGDEYHQQGMVQAIQSARFFVAHHSKFELQWLQRCGVESGSILVWDTLLGQFVIAGNRRFDLSLEGTAKYYGLGSKVHYVKTLIEQGICPSNIPEQWLLEYCSEDTLLCHAIFLKQRERIVEAGLLPVMFTRCLLTPVLADIEMRGVQLDAKRVKEEYEASFSTYAKVREELSRFAGDLNWSSPKQVGDYIYNTLGFEERRVRGVLDRTESGRPRTGVEALSGLSARTKDQRKFLELFKEYKRLEKKVQNLDKLKTCVEVDDGRLYAQFNQAVAGTHRLTSSGLRHKVQFQNIDHTLKSLFCCRSKDWQVGEADGVQLEFRVAAHLGRDAIALADVRNPTFDVHWQTAEAMYEKPRTQLDKETHRRDSKQFTFRPLYGGSAGDKRVRKYIEFFQKRYKGIYETQTRWTYEVLKNKKLVTETGLTFYWPDTVLEESSNGRGYIRNRTAIFNYPVQSLATADIIPIAVVYLWHRLRAEGLQTFLVNTVHDSAIAEVHPDEQDSFRNLANRCFTMDCCDYLDRVYHIDFVSPLGASVKVGKNWGEGKEQVYEYDPIKKAA